MIAHFLHILLNNNPFFDVDFRLGLHIWKSLFNSWWNGENLLNLEVTFGLFVSSFLIMFCLRRRNSINDQHIQQFEQQFQQALLEAGDTLQNALELYALQIRTFVRVIEGYHEDPGDPFLLYNPASMDFFDHIAECNKLYNEYERRLAGLPPAAYVNRSIFQLERLVTVFHQQLGDRPSYEIFLLVNYYAQMEPSDPIRVLGIAPAVRVTAGVFSHLTELQLSTIFQSNIETLRFILNSNDIVLGAILP